MKAIGYVRGSTNEQELTINMQKEKIKAYAYAKGLELYEDDIVIESGKSGKDLNRKGIQEILSKVNNGTIQAVVIYKIDRMFRNTQNALKIAELFLSKGVAFHSICESIDTASLYGKFNYTIISAIAELERGLICKRTRDVLQHKKANGEIYGPVPYGYKRVGGQTVYDPIKQKEVIKGGRLEPDENEQLIIKIIQEWSNGSFDLCYSTIAQELNRKGYHTRSGGVWYPQQVKNIINQS